MATPLTPEAPSREPRQDRAVEQVTRRGRPRATIALALLDGVVGLTAAIGAAFVVPTLSSDADLLRFDAFGGMTGPAVALGLVAALALAGLYGLLRRRPFGAALSIAAGVTLVVYELVASWAVGNLFIPPPSVTGTVEVALWLQPLSIIIGVAMVLLGSRAARAPAQRPQGPAPRIARFPVTATALVLVALTVVMGSTYGWAASATGTSLWARFIAWGPGTTYAWTRFPARPLPPAVPVLFAQAPNAVDLKAATGSSNPDQFFTSSLTTALVVIQHDRLVLERYFNGATRSTRITSFSVTKSWDSALVGAAIAAGDIHGLDDPVTRYIPELARKDPRFAAITLRDLLAMRSGLAWDTSGFLENDDSVVWNTPALRQAVLTRVRIAAPPGRAFRYNDFNPLLLGIVLERATGRTVTQWLDQTLWGPLGAQYPGAFLIDSTTGGFEKMESGLTGRPIDLIRLAVLYLNDGTWHGHRVIPRAWVAQSTAYATAGPSRFPGVRYGLGWWTRVIDGIPVYYAWGTTASTSWLHRPWTSWWRASDASLAWAPRAGTPRVAAWACRPGPPC